MRTSLCQAPVSLHDLGIGRAHHIPLAGTRAGVARKPAVVQASNSHKQVWIQTSREEVLTAAVESGFDTLLFPEGSANLGKEWQQLANFQPLHQQGTSICKEDGDVVGALAKVESGEDLSLLQEKAAAHSGVVIMDATDWQVIPAENLVASFQDQDSELFAAVASASDAQVMMEALETGVAGVLLRTSDPVEVRQLSSYLSRMEMEGAVRFAYDVATVVKVEAAGMGDRVCVDLCSMLCMGEGMLVGSFSRALFLVHSECAESRYINSRPFRVNAGPVHAYIQQTDNKTAYLSELKSGSKVLVADAEGRSRTAIVGRIKLETRPLILVEAETPDGEVVSALLQNAETVRLVGPSMGGQGSDSWAATSVSELQEGDQLYVYRQQGARHTGISIDERIVEK
ncbi:unnamed protein product [Ostreobium quekettii]|uniref:3-dehydroquinate synthase n=1 Tax=Ostreobium quekettii TaxID=121088 RepID=A0A8S1INI0_9CHLO|nr:unnamed protein product [Ostreobium quekettii]